MYISVVQNIILIYNNSDETGLMFIIQPRMRREAAGTGAKPSVKLPFSS